MASSDKEWLQWPIEILVLEPLESVLSHLNPSIKDTLTCQSKHKLRNLNCWKGLHHLSRYIWYFVADHEYSHRLLKIILLFNFNVSCSFFRLRLWTTGPGGYSGFRVTRMIQWSQSQDPKKSLGLPAKPKKIPGPKINPQKIPCRFCSPQKFQKGVML